MKNTTPGDRMASGTFGIIAQLAEAGDRQCWIIHNRRIALEDQIGAAIRDASKPKPFTGLRIGDER